MIEHTGMERVLGISHIIVRRNTQGNAQLVFAKVTFEFLLGGTYSAMKNFTELLKQ